MRQHLPYRFSVAFLLLVCAFLIAQLFFTTQSTATASGAEAALAQSGLVPRFIDFDIGAATVRSGASHQDSIPDLPPYVALPNSGYPLTIVNFTVPPDFATGNDFVARVLWSTNTTPCFYVLKAELVGYGPGHSAALYDIYWPGSTTPADEGIIQATTAYNTQELIITLRPYASFPTYPGDAMTLVLTRDAGDINDTCTSYILLRSISLTYQGLTSYMPFVSKSP
ncbi:hypothetical protein TFLX_01250 [Thermoflexales bacterium]|nr:hypothetical protein TFLX_01250 [Thermoflexales bacterium]